MNRVNGLIRQLKLFCHRKFEQCFNATGYWVTQKLPQICTGILRTCIGKVACLQYIFAVISGTPTILDGSSEHGAHNWSNSVILIC